MKLTACIRLVKGRMKSCFSSFFPHGWTALVGLSLLIVEVSRSHSDITNSVGLLWMSDRPIAETSTWQHKYSKEINIHTVGVIRTRKPNKQVAADPRLRPSGHRHWLVSRIRYIFVCFLIYQYLSCSSFIPLFSQKAQDLTPHYLHKSKPETSLGIMSHLATTVQSTYRRNVFVHQTNLGQRITACPARGETRS
jgi:hypothetical protein